MKIIKISNLENPNLDPQHEDLKNSNPPNGIFYHADPPNVPPPNPSSLNYFEGSPFIFNMDASSNTNRELPHSSKPQVQSETAIHNKNAASKFFPNRNLFNEFKSINSVNH